MTPTARTDRTIKIGALQRTFRCVTGLKSKPSDFSQTQLRYFIEQNGNMFRFYMNFVSHVEWHITSLICTALPLIFRIFVMMA